jgi:YebC/PmpR family DNA-binding regulatory protein
MSGHSKWSQIKHKKAITDKKKGQVFSRLSRFITIAAKGGPDPSKNQALAQAIERARAENVPKDNIERAIKKAQEKSTELLEEIHVDALGPGGVAIKIKAITDNRNRTIAELRKILTDHESKMVNAGSIDWMFSAGQIELADPSTLERLEKLFNVLDEHDDVEDVNDNLK